MTQPAGSREVLGDAAWPKLFTNLRYNTAGESHGQALIGILEGFPAGFALSLERIDRELKRRQGGFGRGARMAIEQDRVQVLSGLRQGLTLGSPIALLIENRDHSIDSLPVPNNPRPGHADLVGAQKMGIADPRAVLERASARELAMRVALGAVARQPLEARGVSIFAHVVELGGMACGPAPALDEELKRPGQRRCLKEWIEQRDQSPFYCLNSAAEPALIELVERTQAAGDSLGGIYEVVVTGLPVGLGSYQSGPERLTGQLAAALMSIPAMKGIEFGLGFESARRPGSQVHDAFAPAASVPPERRPSGHAFARLSNRSGGLEGGMTTGEPLWFRVAMKPISTLRRGLPSVDFQSGNAVTATYQRSDVTAVPAASVAGEALTALCLAALA